MQMLNKVLILALFLVGYSSIFAQANTSEKNKSKNWTVYFAFGANRSFYSKSNILLQSSASPAFNFTLYRVRGKDDGGITFNHGAPQYSYEVGYYNNKKVILIYKR